MPQPLIPVGPLLSSGWDRFIADEKRNLELSVRFLLSSVLLFAAAFLGRGLPDTGRFILTLAAVIASAVINMHTAITLIDLILRRERQPSDEITASVEIGRRLFWPFVTVAVLQGLAVLGGLAAFILPGIWLSILLGYGVFLLVEDGTRGLQALAGSAALVKGRWWGVFGRSLATGIIVGLMTSLTTLLILIVVSLFVGFDKVFHFASAVSGLATTDPLVDGIESVIGGIVNAIFIPLGIIYQAKIFHSLKQTR